MSLESINYLPEKTPKAKLFRLIGQLGYRKISTNMPGALGGFVWFENNRDTISYVGVELFVWVESDKLITVTTRTRAGRSFWDLAKQNETIRSIKDYLGGKFETDEGKNRLFLQEEEPSMLQAGLFLPRWAFQNAMGRYQVFISTRKIESSAFDNAMGLSFLDSLNPRFFSNELLISYFVAIWEEYLRGSYVMIMRHAGIVELSSLKRNLRGDEIRQVIDGEKTLEEVCADSFSFQRPKMVCDNFKSLDSRLDLNGALKKPFRKRKKTLFDSLTEYVEMRNGVVHVGSCNSNLTDDNIRKIADDFVLAVDRVYSAFGDCYGLELCRDF